jgi:hypothetical protein
MKPETNVCLELIDEFDNDCKDALIASWSEKDEVKKKLLMDIYHEKDKQRSKLIKKLVELTK